MAKGSSSVVVPANDTFSVDIPFAPPKPEGVPRTYLPLMIHDTRLNTKEAEGLVLLHDGVFGRSLKFRDRHCNGMQDSLRWLLAEIADRHAAAMNR